MRAECGQRRSGVALSIDPADRRRRHRLPDGQLTGIVDQLGFGVTVANR